VLHKVCDCARNSIERPGRGTRQQRGGREGAASTSLLILLVRRRDQGKGRKKGRRRGQSLKKHINDYEVF